ncbi:MAG: hypothetical protein M3Y46_05700, partial [Actinomycetota bacterium]|nr:hypothetical protein [Actinomycetota bacterium]
RLTAAGVLRPGEAAAMRGALQADIDASVERVLASPEPGVDAMFAHVAPPFGGPSSGGRRDDREEVRP